MVFLKYKHFFVAYNTLDDWRRASFHKEWKRSASESCLRGGRTLGEAHWVATWSHPDSSEPARKRTVSSIKMVDHRRSKSPASRFTNSRLLAVFLKVNMHKTLSELKTLWSNMTIALSVVQCTRRSTIFSSLIVIQHYCLLYSYRMDISSHFCSCHGFQDIHIHHVLLF
jgi:hypothetical protein